MIGVIPKPAERRIAQEFFELFKTPWELWVPGREYDVVICTADEIPQNLGARLALIYNSNLTDFDEQRGIALQSRQRNQKLESNGVEFPVYGDLLLFCPAGSLFLNLNGGAEPAVAGFEVSESKCQFLRIGYDLFQEVSYLLSQGQPAENAGIPALEVHIWLLRSFMLRAGIPFVEVPPVPPGYDFMVCLTHDVDFTGIRNHKFDATMWGFLYRALVGSFLAWVRGRLEWTKLAQNWKAALYLPFVYLGWKPDFWLEFDRYLEMEKGLGSTFFFIPHKNQPGHQASGPAPKRRAAKYDVAEIQEQVRQLARSGCEVGVHGIDAWLSSRKAQVERGRIAEVAGQSACGVRMHWLYFAEDSPKTLEEAGFSYDSTFGYNDAVGFRAGTTQVFCPPVAQSLLELPLNIQDTALFYPSRMGLSPGEAFDSCKKLIQFASLLGGALTVNWHTRSLSPERLWGDFYARLLGELRLHRVWFGTGAEITEWFRKRRAFRFDQVTFEENRVQMKLTGTSLDGQPPLALRIYHPKSALPTYARLSTLTQPYSDISWKGETELEIAS